MIGKLSRIAWLALISSNKDRNKIRKSRKDLKREGMVGRNSENYVPRLNKAPRRRKSVSNERY
jgi:hypothetical protein